MKILGILVNLLAIIVAGGIGVIFRGKLKARFQEILVQACGLAVILLGFYTAWDSFFIIQDGQLETEGTFLVVVSLLLGALLGELIEVERLLDKLGGVFSRFTAEEEKKEAIRSAKRKQARESRRVALEAQGKTLSRSLDELPTYNLPNTRSGNLSVDGFTLATVITACSALTLRGVFESGLNGDPVPLFIKSAVDAALILVLAVVYGSGVTFSAIPVLVMEGVALLCALLWGEHLTAEIVNQLCLVASAITIFVGIHMAFGKKLKPANLIPALYVPVFYHLLMNLVEKLVEAE